MAEGNVFHRKLGTGSNPQVKAGPVLAIPQVLVLPSRRRAVRQSDPLRAIVDTGSQVTLVPKSALILVGARLVHGEEIRGRTATDEPCHFAVYDAWLQLPDFSPIPARVGAGDGDHILLGMNLWHGRHCLHLQINKYRENDSWTLTLDPS